MIKTSNNIYLVYDQFPSINLRQHLAKFPPTRHKSSNPAIQNFKLWKPSQRIYTPFIQRTLSYWDYLGKTCTLSKTMKYFLEIGVQPALMKANARQHQPLSKINTSSLPLKYSNLRLFPQAPTCTALEKYFKK